MEENKESEEERIPTYIPPNKRKIIEYGKDNQWKKATINLEINGYGGDWYNIKQDEVNKKGSVKLNQDSLWRYEDPGCSDFYYWRWSHLNQNREDKDRLDTGGENVPCEGVR